MSYGMDGWNHDNDLVRRKDVMDSLVKEYNRRYSLGERNGLKLAWIEKAVNDVAVAQQHSTPCDLCVYGPPTSMDGKPCSSCPAEGRM